MAEQILVTKARDERELLKKKIIRAIDDASFVATKRKKDDKCANGYTRGMSPVSLLDIEEFKQNATSQYQSINDMIKRYNDINAAITLSNATTVITVAGKEITRAAAITLRKSIMDARSSDNFDRMLLDKMIRNYNDAVEYYTKLTQIADNQAASYTNNFIGNDSNKKLNDDELAAVKQLTDDLYPEFIDPIGIADEINAKTDYLDAVVSEIESAIKISNATTYIEI